MLRVQVALPAAAVSPKRAHRVPKGGHLSPQRKDPQIDSKFGYDLCPRDRLHNGRFDILDSFFVPGVSGFPDLEPPALDPAPLGDRRV